MGGQEYFDHSNPPLSTESDRHPIDAACDGLIFQSPRGRARYAERKTADPPRILTQTSAALSKPVVCARTLHPSLAKSLALIRHRSGRPQLHLPRRTSCSPIAEAEKLMREKNLTQLPVLTREKRIIGIVTLEDIAREQKATSS